MNVTALVRKDATNGYWLRPPADGRRAMSRTQNPALRAGTCVPYEAEQIRVVMHAEDPLS